MAVFTLSIPISSIHVQTGSNTGHRSFASDPLLSGHLGKIEEAMASGTDELILAIENGQLVAMGRLHILEINIAKICRVHTQMDCAVGRLLDLIEDKAALIGVRKLILDASSVHSLWTKLLKKRGYILLNEKVSDQTQVNSYQKPL